MYDSDSVWGSLEVKGQCGHVLTLQSFPPEDRPEARGARHLQHTKAKCLLKINYNQEVRWQELRWHFWKHARALQRLSKAFYIFIHHCTCMNISTVWWVLKQMKQVLIQGIYITETYQGIRNLKTLFMRAVCLPDNLWRSGLVLLQPTVFPQLSQ